MIHDMFTNVFPGLEYIEEESKHLLTTCCVLHITLSSVCVLVKLMISALVDKEETQLDHSQEKKFTQSVFIKAAWLCFFI
jgi:hypothetical protein